MSHFPSLIATFAVLLPFAVHAAFTDTTDHRYADAISFVQAEGIVQGYDDGTYRPDSAINRAEFTKIIVEASGIEPGSCDDVPLTDIAPESWYAAPVCGAVTAGVINGYPDGTFRPADSINLAEAATIVVRAYDLPIRSGSGAWYEPSLRALANTDVTLTPWPEPGALLTRGEMAAIIHAIWVGDRVGTKLPSCVITGCSGQLCIEEGSESGFTTCEFRPEYACYQSEGVCERQMNGACGWTMTDALRQCLDNPDRTQ